MKAEELMIGDWVYLRDANEEYSDSDWNNKVDAITEGIIWHNGESYSLVKSEPIHLTEEILDKNKFEKHRGLYATSIQPNIGESVSILISDNTGIECLDEDIIVRVKYVHELQHILRFCRFNELANNFVV